MLRKFRSTLSLFALLLLAGSAAHAQELQADVQVTTQNVTITDPTLVTQMQNEIRNLLNTQAWTSQTYRPEERIKVRMFIGITAIPQNGTYNATMRLISTRPVYGTGYETNVISLTDRSFNFNYSPQNPIAFSQNSFTSNLASLLGYYAYLVIGIDRDTFGRLGGTPYYELARNVVNYSANQTLTNEVDEGWRGSGSRERHFLLDNLTDPQLEAFRTGLYSYYRLGMDVFIEKPEEARASVMTALTGIQKAVITRPGALLTRAFFDAKSDEIANIFRTSSDQNQKQQLVAMLTEVDPGNSAKYQTVLK
ncbi:type IX secretion system protein PorD [Hymenobacter convexus]|uniref:type IX secretion system protein PorD n=1 Tax=Hymenobacter sp. CA1UV-4 TaxID=3063782 RepID=UPI002712B3EF|nr:DUF4835 family protein [Hymenobacter sp. CA1UV-4]MDO7853030.1 DUF4835 family protein [Hymenobacter sp. CA1UV-4]